MEINSFLSRSYDHEKIEIVNESTSSNPPKPKDPPKKEKESIKTHSNLSTEESRLINKENV